MEVTLNHKRKPKEAPPPRAGKSSPSLHFTAGLRFASHFPLRSKCGWSPLTCFCYPPVPRREGRGAATQHRFIQEGKTRLRLAGAASS